MWGIRLIETKKISSLVFSEEILLIAGSCNPIIF